jgi:hypothetical protein
MIHEYNHLIDVVTEPHLNLTAERLMEARPENPASDIYLGERAI